MRSGCLFSLIVMSFVPSVLCPESARPPASPLSSARCPPVLRLTPARPLSGVRPVLRPAPVLSSARLPPVLCPASALSSALTHLVLHPGPACLLSGVRPVLCPAPTLSSTLRPSVFRPAPAGPPPGARPSSVRRPPVLCRASARSCPRTHSGTLGFPLAFPPPTVTTDNLEGFNSIFG